MCAFVCVSGGRLWHTACLGLDGEVFVFGGCANNLLSNQQAVSIEILSPKSPVCMHLHFASANNFIYMQDLFFVK